MKTKFACNLLKAMVALAIGMLSSATAFCQDDPGPNPDGTTPAVPMDDNMHIILIAAGIMFAFFVLRRLRAQHSIKH